MVKGNKQGDAKRREVGVGTTIAQNCTQNTIRAISTANRICREYRIKRVPPNIHIIFLV